MDDHLSSPYRSRALAAPDPAEVESALLRVSSWSGMDPGVSPLVAALQARGLPTFMSCEGHIDSGTFWPWVSFSVEDSAPGANAWNLGAHRATRQRREALLEVLWELITPYHGAGSLVADDELFFHPLPVGHHLVYLQPSCFPAAGTGLSLLREFISPARRADLLARSRSELDLLVRHLSSPESP